ncbi:hypothetical protein C8R44DRAFT_876681 [Mycena epipterygia]|nr:hypothetical protein C8R44DRAFT_876681 [Mycena epipterygia]
MKSTTFQKDGSRLALSPTINTTLPIPTSRPNSDSCSQRSNSELIHFVLQADKLNALEVYIIISRQSVPNDKPRRNCPSAQHISLSPFAVDQNHLKRPARSLSAPASAIEAMDLCIIKRSAIVLRSPQNRIFYQKEISLSNGAVLALRSGHFPCITDKT